MINKLLGYLSSRFIAAEPSQRRRDPGTTIKTADGILIDAKRRRLIEGARDLQRNYATAAWAIRKHLDYVSTFTFQAATENEEFNEELETLMGWWGRPLNFDVAARHGLRRFTRMLEARRVIDGDVFVVKMRDGRLQAIEGDRVRNPDVKDTLNSPWIHGVKLGPGGKLASVAVHSRTPEGRYAFEREIKSGNVVQLGYFDAFDQIRGVSPLSSAIVDFQDVLEVHEYARAKAKVTQLFALAITREMGDADEDEETNGEYSVDFGRGPIKLEMDPGDKAEFLESKHPSTEFMSFMTVTLQAALKSLDIPWSFYDEAYTNFFGSRAALIQYQQSCRSKRDDLKELLDRLTVWRLQLWIANGTLTLPAGMTLSDIYWDWIPAGVPWWNPEQEINGDILAIDAGLRTRTEIRRERYGDDWKDVIRKLRAEEEFMAEQGVVLKSASAPADPVDQGDEPPNTAEEDNQDGEPAPEEAQNEEQ